MSLDRLPCNWSNEARSIFATWRPHIAHQQRLAERNRREDANALTVTPEALDDFFARFDFPTDDEEVIVYTEDLDALVAALSAVRHRQV